VTQGNFLDGVTLDPVVRCYTSAPVVTFGQYVGSIVVTCPEPKQFKQADLGSLQHAAGHVGQLLDKKLQNTVTRAVAM